MRNRLRSIVAFCLLMALALPLMAAGQSEGKRGITPEDYYAFVNVSDPRLSPDGKLIAYVITTVDQRQNRRHSSVWYTSRRVETSLRRVSRSLAPSRPHRKRR